jgi:hypothetical protein
MRDIDSPEHEALYIQEPEVVTSSVDRIKHILDAKYERANLREIVQSAEHLCQRRRDRLYTTLKRHELCRIKMLSPITQRHSQFPRPIRLLLSWK